MKKTALLIQPGAFGDIFTCAPIAKHFHDEGIEVHWAVPEKYKDHLNSITAEYAKTIVLDDVSFPQEPDWLRVAAYQCYNMARGFDIVIDLADRDPRGGKQLPKETPEETKYRLAGLPFNIKHALTWKRDIKKEKSLYAQVVGDLGEYVVASLGSSHGDRTELPEEETRRVIEITPKEGYNIVDWFEVIQRAKAVYCVESAVQCFVDGCISQLPSTQPRYLLKRSSIKNNKPYTVARYWDFSHF